MPICATSAPTLEGPSAAADLPLARRRLIFAVLMCGFFMATLDNQIVSTALPSIVGEFGAIERFGWVGSAYLLAQSTVMPVYGKLGDLFGRKYLMMVAIGLFTLGSLVCGLAWSMDSLIAARVLQGIGGGGIAVSIFSINADLFAPRERAKYQSFSSLVLMLSGSLGPTIGGTLSQAFGWRSIFMVNLPIGVGVLAALWFLLPLWRPHRSPRIDFAGAATLAIAIACTVLWADSRTIFGSMFAGRALVLPAITVLAVLLWLRIERRVPEPIVPLHLFANRNFPLLLMVAVASGGVAIGMVNYHALFLQITTGLAPARAGLFFIAVTGGIAAGSLTAGRLIAATGRYKPWLICGLSLSCLCLFGLSRLPLEAPMWLVAGLFMGQGIGVGLGQQSPVIGVQAVTPPGDIGAATGAVTLSRIGGASLAISIYGALLASQLAAQTVPGITDLPGLSPGAVSALSDATQQAVRLAYRHVFTGIYTAASALVGIGLLCALALRPAVLLATRAPAPEGSDTPPTALPAPALKP